MKKPFDPFENLVLDAEEQAIEDDLEKNGYVSDPNLEETKKFFQAAAIQYRQLKNSKPVTIRINQLDLIKLKARAKKKQIPYQTLLGSLIHQYAEGEKEFSV